MNVNYQPKALARLDAKLKWIEGKGSRNLAQNIAAALTLGNEHDRLRGLNKYGQPQAPVKPRKGPYKGATGPPIAPHNSASRVISHFRAKVKGSRPPYTVVAGWEGVVSKSGLPFLVFLDQGVRGKGRGRRRGSKLAHRIKSKLTGSWLIPPRPIFGISPNTWKLVREEIDDFKRDFKKVG